jgi:hypothetical protein
LYTTLEEQRGYPALKDHRLNRTEQTEGTELGSPAESQLLGDFDMDTASSHGAQRLRRTFIVQHMEGRLNLALHSDLFPGNSARETKFLTASEAVGYLRPRSAFQQFESGRLRRGARGEYLTDTAGFVRLMRDWPWFPCWMWFEFRCSVDGQPRAKLDVCANTRFSPE